MNPRLGSAMPGDVRLGRATVPSCPTCHNTFPAGTAVCPRDGARLTTTGASTEAGLVMAATVPGLPTPAPSASGATSGSAARPVIATAPATAAKADEGRFDPLVGAVLADRYQIVRRIGEGGMGAVYEAKHTVIGKRVAVKVLLEKFLAKSDFVARLLQEARLAAADRAQPRHRAPGGERPRRRARQGDLSPRRQTREHLPGQTQRRRLRE